MNIRILFILLCIASINLVDAQTTPFNKGVNLTGWFQVNGPEQIQFSKFSKKDFENIKSLGCDVIRVPVSLYAMTDGAPHYNVDPLFLNFFDQVVDWAEELEIYVIFDNHTSSGVGVGTSNNEGAILNKVWKNVAEHYKDDSEYLMYEIYNEPFNIDETIWSNIQRGVIDEIRTVDTKHQIIVGGANWNSLFALDGLADYEDDKLIYTFHFYEPFIFTHQGASWTDVEPLVGVPFPYDADLMPALPAVLQNTWIENAYNGYSQDGNVERIKELIDLVVDFREERNVPVFCGEFGVYIPESNNVDRVRWYDAVANYMDEKNIAWTIWDYKGGFGIFDENGNGLFDHDLNTELLDALNFNIPPQSPFVLLPDSVGFPIYRDNIEANIIGNTYSDGLLSFYNEDNVGVGNYSMSWSGASQYNGVVFEFQPKKDLTYLLEQDYALELLVRADDPNSRIDIRFLDSKKDASDRPWRNRITLEGSDFSASEWTKIYVPLKDFQEHGSWDDNMWWELPFKIFPNPVKDKIFIEGINPDKVLIFNGLGQLVFQGDQNEINVSNLPSGIYFLSLEKGEEVFNQKVVVE